jgi:hypothetical protein
MDYDFRHPVYAKIQDNFSRNTSDLSDQMSYEDKHNLALNNALLQCIDMSNVPSINEHVYVDINAKIRKSANCNNCTFSKDFYYIKNKSTLICLKKLIDLSFEDSIVDNEHICMLHEYKQNNCCCCNCKD